jgi:putative FmdB family regulatory protein
MPIYEYKCPNGHLFEVFHGMTEPSPTACEVCGDGPLQTVLHPVAVHYKGSGFYSTDYGRKSKQSSKDGGSGESSTSSDGSGEGGSSSDKSSTGASSGSGGGSSSGGSSGGESSGGGSSGGGSSGGSGGSSDN